MSNTAQPANVFLDYAAGTPVDTEVLAAMLPYFSEEYRNPSSMHAGGRRAHRALEDERQVVADTIGAQPREIIFTSSGSESDNLAVLGVARAYKKYGNHVIISAIEHKAVLEAASVLTEEGFVVTTLPVDAFGKVSVSELLAQVTEETILVSCIYGNNELGTIEPIEELARALRARRGANGLPLLHTDACQAFSYLPVAVEKLGVDLMTFNSVKLYGPAGVAALYVRSGVRLTPLVVGGEQEHHLRAGTEPLPLIVGFAHAVRKARALHEQEAKRLGELRAYFIERLHRELPDVLVNGHPTEVLPSMVHVTVPGIEGEAMLLMLDSEGVSVSTGSACSAYDLRPSHVLTAIGQDSNLIHGSIRFSFGRSTTQQDLDYARAAFVKTVTRLHSISAVTTHAYEIHR